MVHETVVLEGHLIDSDIMRRVFDRVVEGGGAFEVQEFRVGRTNDEGSYARIDVRAGDSEASGRVFVEDENGFAPLGGFVLAEWSIDGIGQGLDSRPIGIGGRVLLPLRDPPPLAELQLCLVDIVHPSFSYDPACCRCQRQDPPRPRRGVGPGLRRG